MKKPIFAYCRRVEGWEQVPNHMLGLKPEAEPYFVCFVNIAKGIQVIGSVKEGRIHASVSPVPSLNPKLDRNQVIEEVETKGAEFLPLFFGDLEFVSAPDDPRNPTQKHFMHYFPKREVQFSEN